MRCGHDKIWLDIGKILEREGERGGEGERGRERGERGEERERDVILCICVQSHIM